MKLKFGLIALLFALSAPAKEPIKVAIIDSGLSLHDYRFEPFLCKSGHKDFTGTGIQDDLGHGTHIAGSIIRNGPESGYCLLILKFYTEEQSGLENLKAELMALRYAVSQGAKIINLSLYGKLGDYHEKTLIMENPGVTFVAAAGNDGENLDEYGNGAYPASYDLKNIVAVGALSTTGQRLSSSNWGRVVTAFELGENVLSDLPMRKYGSQRRMFMAPQGYMSGSSMATSIHTGKLIKERLNGRP